MVKKISLFLCILLMTGCVNLDNRSRMNAYFADMIMNQRQKGATELIQFKTDDGESTNTVPTFNFSSETKKVRLSFETPYSWYVDKSTLADWVSLSRTSGKAGVVELSIEVQDNLSYDEREAVIDIKSGDFTYHIRIYQKGNDASVDLAEDADNIYVKVTPANPEVKEAVGIIPVDDVMSSSKPAVIKIEGIGNFTFDNDAKASILANAEAEGATSVYFKIEDVTTTKPVPDADVVLEVTMKTVDENGIEVYNEVNAAGEVTIEIPMDENVAYVHRVTLVNDAGEPVEGGVVPGSEKIENGVLIFKVNHFSKYAIDYVTKADFVSVTGVILDLASVTLPVGDEYNLSKFVTITPDNATNKKVTWSSSDESVATVDASGKITTVDAGEAIITVTTEDGGFSATCTVKVEEVKTMAEILADTDDVPESDNDIAPANAWVSSVDPNCRAFIGVINGEKRFILKKDTQGFWTLPLNCNYYKVDDNTYEFKWSPYGTFTINLKDGKFTSLKYEPSSDSRYAFLGGTYSASSETGSTIESFNMKDDDSDNWN